MTGLYISGHPLDEYEKSLKIRDINYNRNNIPDHDEDYYGCD